MKKIILYSMIFAALSSPFAVLAQNVNVTQASSLTVNQLLRQHFVGEGIQIYNAKVPGTTDTNATITSNQFGYFTNSDTSNGHIPASDGVYMGTHNVTSTGTASADITNEEYAQPLRTILTQMGMSSSHAMHNIAVMVFDFISEGSSVAFQYCFTSNEYPNYTCSNYNDVFGFFISGPYYDSDPNGSSAMENTFVNKNLAIIPGTDTLPVTINSINSGSGGSFQPCFLDNSQYFQGGGNNQPSLTGWHSGWGATKLLQTTEVSVIPCRRYRLMLAVCNVSDAALPSGVFLKANSFKAIRYNFTDTPQGDTSSTGDTTLYIKGCSQTTLTLTRNISDFAQNQQVIFGGDARQDTDYVVTDQLGNTIGNYVYFDEGVDEVTLIVKFMDKDSTEAFGTIKRMSFKMASIAHDLGCATYPQDSLEIFMTRKDHMKILSSGSKVFCGDVMPVIEDLSVDVFDPIGDVQYQWTTANGQPIGTNPNGAINPCVFTDSTTVYLVVTDMCSRYPYAMPKQRDTLIFYVNEPYVKAQVLDADAKICEGDSIQLKASDTQGILAQYNWTSSASDLLLASNNSLPQPWAMPIQTAWFKITTTDTNGCIASDSVKVTVISAVNAAMILDPLETSFLEPNINYESTTPFAKKWEWDFGDGGSSAYEKGIHTYSGGDTGTYIVRLIAFNEAGCPDTAYGQVRILDLFSIYIPTALLAGDDGINGRFQPIGARVTDWEMTIYNRWGTLINQTDAQKGGWDGKLSNGEYATEGTYVYDLIYRDGTGLQQRRTGTFSLIRFDKH
jgi:gliding motility-associated-like protein